VLLSVQKSKKQNVQEKDYALRNKFCYCLFVEAYSASLDYALVAFGFGCFFTPVV
jgi:hypothetical protein